MVSRTQWLKLKPETRGSIAVLLGIPKSSGTEVVDGVVVSDGYTDANLAMIDLQRLQAFMESEETDFYKLFDLLVSRLEQPPTDLEDLSTVELDEVSAPVVNYEEPTPKPKIKRNKK